MPTIAPAPAPIPAPTGKGGTSSGGTTTGTGTTAGVDSGYENKVYGGLTGEGGAGNIPEGYEFTPDELGGGTWTPPEPTAQPGDITFPAGGGPTYAYGSREDFAAKAARGSTTY